MDITWDRYDCVRKQLCSHASWEIEQDSKLRLERLGWSCPSTLEAPQRSRVHSGSQKPAAS